MWNKDTIVALASAGGHSATALIRLSGAKAVAISAAHCGKAMLQLQANAACFARFRSADNVVLDDVVLTFFRGPKSYTGEDVVEISFHGSPFIISAALEALVASGARLAMPGEFTQRAFLNGKMDLSQAEAVADLIASE